MAVAVLGPLVEFESAGQALGRVEPEFESPSMAIPRQGHVLATVAENFGGPVRRAVEVLRKSIREGPRHSEFLSHWEQCYGHRGPHGVKSRTRDPSELAGWFAVSSWAVAVAAGQIKPLAGLLEAENWMFAADNARGICRFATPGSLETAAALLHESSNARALSDLLPYLLDPHGPGSRLSVRREPATQTARQRKREEGVYYTPADVATYMAKEALEGLTNEAVPLTVFDPACGTGVFLRAAMETLLARTPAANRLDVACTLYGCDIDEWALDASAFVLLLECVRPSSLRNAAPISAWHAIRMNLAHLDTLILEPGWRVPEDHPLRVARLQTRSSLRIGRIPPIHWQALAEGACRIDEVFPEISEGPRVIIGNPPYASVGDEANFMHFARAFKTFAAAPRASSDVYPLFVEQMIRLAAPNSHGGALVVPLSIACNSRPQFAALRELISREPGTWRFAFFDREPHALFGEDVKTRNAIVLWKREAAKQSVAIHTGPLRKWRADDRATLFKRIAFTPIAVDLRLGIPKVDGPREAAVLETLLGETCTLERAVTALGRATLVESFGGKPNTVYVGATAYNFLNVFLRPTGFENAGAEALTEHHLHAVMCPNDDAALSTFAALSGNLAFWWWHIHGDGFHVTRHTLEAFPVGKALSSPAAARRLTSLGRSLWGQVCASPKISRNRGKLSLGFSAAGHSEVRREIDELLLEAVGVETAFASVLEDFSRKVVRADAKLTW